MGIKITEGQENIKLHQNFYVKAVLEKFGMTHVKSAETPLIKRIVNEKENMKGGFPYQAAIGNLLYMVWIYTYWKSWISVEKLVDYI